MSAGRWRRAGWALVIGGLVVLAAAVLTQAWSAEGTELDRVAAWADIWAVPLTVVGLLLVIADKWRTGREITPSSLAATLDFLASEILGDESKRRAGLLGTDRPDVKAANVVGSGLCSRLTLALPVRSHPDSHYVVNSLTGSSSCS